MWYCMVLHHNVLYCMVSIVYVVCCVMYYGMICHVRVGNTPIWCGVLVHVCALHIIVLYCCVCCGRTCYDVS